MSENRLPDYLDHIQQAATDARSFVEGMAKDDFLADKRTQQAVIMSLIDIGEAATKVMDGYVRNGAMTNDSKPPMFGPSGVFDPATYEPRSGKTFWMVATDVSSLVGKEAAADTLIGNCTTARPASRSNSS
ncbi:HepT-like ribonuclease domain-containing protein [Solilutibacter pythonis]|uniref:HepT-like ribonuclease domain-containing protein n=1 Tax=Solilutibacter pythonis TaxID=2483112 RepID=UPI0026BFB0C7